MREDLLHYIWKFRKLVTKGLATTCDQSIVIIYPGKHNLLSGPDFFNARLEIGGQEWAGNVEIHLKASDWYAHGHEEDDRYKNVILHVVWENDVAVFGKGKTEIPTLELKKFIPKKLLATYNELLRSRRVKFINCEKDIASSNKFILENWLERLYFERLEQKSEFIIELLRQFNNDWERVLFVLLLKNFGLKINGTSFLSLARALDFLVVRKVRTNVLQLESLLFGMAGLLNSEAIRDRYYLELREEYRYLKKKFRLDASGVLAPEFFKLRPPNFPTVRLSQFAALYSKSQLFSLLMEASDKHQLVKIMGERANAYWNNHYSFGRHSPGKPKKMTLEFIELLLINAIVPLKFCFYKEMGRPASTEIVALMSDLKKEDNNLLGNFRKLGINIRNALESQALLQLYNQYCSHDKCLHCNIGVQLLSGK